MIVYINIVTMMTTIMIMQYIVMLQVMVNFDPVCLQMRTSNCTRCACGCQRRRSSLGVLIFCTWLTWLRVFHVEFRTQEMDQKDPKGRHDISHYTHLEENIPVYTICIHML